MKRLRNETKRKANGRRSKTAVKVSIGKHLCDVGCCAHNEIDRIVRS